MFYAEQICFGGTARKLTSNRMTYTSAKCTVNELLMMGRGNVRNM